MRIPGYLIYRNDRGSRHGGGVAFYVIDNLSNTEIIAVDTTMTTDVECVWINIKRPHNRSLTVGSMYRPPSANQAYYESMIDILDNINNDDHEIVLKADLYKEMPAINSRISSGELSVTEAWSSWKSTYEMICSVHTPIKQIRVKNRDNPWMTRDILNLMYQRDHLHKEATRRKNSTTWAEYKRACNNVVHSINDAQKMYYHNQVTTNHGNTNSMWKALKHILGSHSNITANDIQADTFNEYFTEIGSNLADQSDNTTYSCRFPRTIHTFNPRPIETEFVH